MMFILGGRRRMARDAVRMRTARLCSILCVACCLSWTVAVFGEDKPSDFSASAEEQLKQLVVKVEARGTSSKKVRDSAMGELPLVKLTQTQRRVADQVLQNQSLYRRLPTVSFDIMLPSLSVLVTVCVPSGFNTDEVVTSVFSSVELTEVDVFSVPEPV